MNHRKLVAGSNTPSFTGTPSLGNRPTISSKSSLPVPQLSAEYLESVAVLNETNMSQACAWLLSEDDYNDPNNKNNNDGEDNKSELDEEGEGASSKSSSMNDTNKTNTDNPNKNASGSNSNNDNSTTKKTTDYQKLLDLQTKCRDAAEVVKKQAVTLPSLLPPSIPIIPAVRSTAPPTARTPHGSLLPVGKTSAGTKTVGKRSNPGALSLSRGQLNFKGGPTTAKRANAGNALQQQQQHQPSLLQQRHNSDESSTSSSFSSGKSNLIVGSASKKARTSSMPAPPIVVVEGAAGGGGTAGAGANANSPPPSVRNFLAKLNKDSKEGGVDGVVTNPASTPVTTGAEEVSGGAKTQAATATASSAPTAPTAPTTAVTTPAGGRRNPPRGAAPR